MVALADGIVESSEVDRRRAAPRAINRSIGLPTGYIVFGVVHLRARAGGRVTAAAPFEVISNDAPIEIRWINTNRDARCESFPDERTGVSERGRYCAIFKSFVEKSFYAIGNLPWGRTSLIIFDKWDATCRRYLQP